MIIKNFPSTKNTLTNKNKLVKLIRYIISVIILGFVTIEAYLHIAVGGDKYASIHALCPYGALESLYTLIFNGNTIQKVFPGTFIILGLILIISIIFRRSFCGIICPFGTIQELSGLLGSKIFKKTFQIPKKIDKPLRYLKYLVLFTTLFYAWKTAGLWMSPYDPWAAYGHITEGLSSMIGEFLIGSILLLITIIGSMLYDRFFCKYLCPMGAFYGILSKLSIGKLTRNEDSCINCDLCNKNCPVNLKVSEMKIVKSAECINCQSCVLSCPKKDTLQYKVFGKNIKPLYVIILVVTIFFGGITIAKVVNIYNVTPAPITSSTVLTAEEIKGYMTIEQVSTSFKIDLSDLYKKLDLPTTIPKETKLKDVKNFVEGFEVEKVKENLK